LYEGEFRTAPYDHILPPPPQWPLQYGEQVGDKLRYCLSKTLFCQLALAGALNAVGMGAQLLFWNLLPLELQSLPLH
jgi:hypothetical protein